MNDRTTISLVGINQHHQPGEYIVRPHGAGEYVFLHFLTPVEVRAPGRDVETVVAQPGEVLIWAPDTPEYYGGREVGLGNDWFHARGADVGRVLRSLRLPTDRVLRPYRTAFIAPLLEEIQTELAAPDAHSPWALSVLFHRFCLQLRRELNRAEAQRVSPRGTELFDRFRELRAQMAARSAEDWDVPRMAATVHLSRARFLALYREYFGTSPVQDLIDMRVAQAKWLLEATSLPIGEIAERCGFQSPYYFSRLFRSRVGCTARDYRAGK